MKELSEEFFLHGVLRIQSNPYILISKEDLSKWEGIEMLDRIDTYTTLEGLESKRESVIKIHTFSNFNYPVIELEYLGNCLLYRSYEAMALVYSEPKEEVDHTSFIPFEFLTFQVDGRTKLTPFKTWCLMDSVIRGTEIGFNSTSEGIFRIIGIEGFDLLCSDFHFNEVAYVEGEELKGVILI